MTHILGKLQDIWGVKLLLSIGMAFVAEAHVQLFWGFAVLVFLDLFTKWLALSRQRLVDMGAESPTLFQSLIGLRAARRDGYIRSEEMRKRFVNKMLAYICIVASSVVLDWMLAHAGAPAFAMPLAISYLSITELVSILENMQKSGVEEAGGICELIKKKGGMGK